MEKRWRAVRWSDQRDMVCCTIELAKRFVSDYPEFGPGWLCYGASLYQVARYKEALVALRRAARLCPPESLHLVESHFGHLYQQKGNSRRAEHWFRRAIATAPARASAYIYLGALLARQGRLPAAEALHRKATQCEGDPIDEALFNLGLILRAQERYPEALVCFQKAFKIDPKYKLAQKALQDIERTMKLTRTRRWS